MACTEYFPQSIAFKLHETQFEPGNFFHFLWYKKFDNFLQQNVKITWIYIRKATFIKKPTFLFKKKGKLVRK
jgi:hypothetical protein